MEQVLSTAQRDRILDFLKPDIQSHLSFVCEEYDDINDVVTNLSSYLTENILDTDGKPLATNIILKSFQNSYQKTTFPTLKQYSENPITFKISLFNELSSISRYLVEANLLGSDQKSTWNPRLTSFCEWKSSSIDPQTITISISNPIDSTTDFRISVAIQIFDCLQFLNEEAEHA